jgi:hypothetical protein
MKISGKIHCCQVQAGLLGQSRKKIRPMEKK